MLVTVVPHFYICICKGSNWSRTLSPIRTHLILSHFDLLYFTGKIIRTVMLQPKGHSLQKTPSIIFVKETAASRYLHSSQTSWMQKPPVLSDSHPVVGLWFSNCFPPTPSSLVLWLSCRNASVPGLQLHVSLCCCQSTCRQCSWFWWIWVPWSELWAGKLCTGTCSSWTFCEREGVGSFVLAELPVCSSLSAGWQAVPTGFSQFPCS